MTFLSEKKVVDQDSLAMGASTKDQFDSVDMKLQEWVELWDYLGDMRFRGFVGGHILDRSLFIFFESSAIGKDLKPGLMALLEFASYKSLGCSKLVVCLSRSIDPTESKNIMRDLGWVGFELVTLAQWTGTTTTSSEWLFLSIEL